MTVERKLKVFDESLAVQLVMVKDEIAEAQILLATLAERGENIAAGCYLRAAHNLVGMALRSIEELKNESRNG